MRVKGVAERNPQAAALRQGDLGAFQEVYDLHATRVHRFLFRLTGDPAVAEDLLQDTWLSFARNAHKLDLDTDVTAWLFTVARNRYRSWRRWALFDRLRLERLRVAPVEHAPPADDDFARGETQARLEAAIQRLSPALREVLLLVVVEGLDTRQVASVLGLGPDAVRQRLSRARAELRKHLEKKLDTPLARVDEGAKP